MKSNFSKNNDSDKTLLAVCGGDFVEDNKLMLTILLALASIFILSIQLFPYF